MLKTIYLWEPERLYLIDEIEFYSAELVKRVFRAFDNFETELEEHLETMSASFSACVPYDDWEAFLDFQNDEAHEFGQRMYDVSREMFLAALSALYFFWDRQLKTFLERELRHSPDFDCKELWNLNAVATLRKVFSDYEENDNFIKYDLLENIRLKVNVFKHGKGPSLNALRKRNGITDNKFLALIDPNWICEQTISTDEKEFAALTSALTSFWKDFPEHCHHRKY